MRKNLASVDVILQFAGYDSFYSIRVSKRGIEFQGHYTQELFERLSLLILFTIEPSGDFVGHFEDLDFYLTVDK